MNKPSTNLIPVKTGRISSVSTGRNIQNPKQIAINKPTSNLSNLKPVDVQGIEPDGRGKGVKRFDGDERCVQAGLLRGENNRVLSNRHKPIEASRRCRK